jgi:hypothetical protein
MDGAPSRFPAAAPGFPPERILMARPKLKGQSFVAIATGDIDDVMEPISGANPLPVSLQAGGGAELRVDGWDGSAQDTDGYSVAFIEVSGYTTAITIKCGVDLATAQLVSNTTDWTDAATITANGTWCANVFGDVTATGVGGATLNLILKR